MEKFAIPFKAGLFAGLVLIAYTTLTYLLDANILNPGLAILTIVVTYGAIIAAAVIATNQMRDHTLGGKVDYLTALIACFITLTLAQYLHLLFSTYLFQSFDPEFMPRKIDAMLDSLARMGVADEQMDKVIKKLDEQSDPMKNFMKNLWIAPLVSLVLGALIALFIKKDKTKPELV